MRIVCNKKVYCTDQNDKIKSCAEIKATEKFYYYGSKIYRVTACMITEQVYKLGICWKHK